jgi:hypothetical protein
MKIHLKLVAALSFVCASSTIHAQPGLSGGMGGSPGPKFDAAMAKIFGEHKAFSADVQIVSKDVTMPSKMAYSEGKSRFEMDMTKATGSQLPSGAAEQMKAMGMGTMTMISRPDKKISYIVYPGLESYSEMELKDPSADTPADKIKMDVTELAKETVDGHACVKNKVVVTDDKGNKHESTVWNATDLKKFPVKIVQGESGQETTMIFKEVKFSKPDAAQFEPPSAFKKYGSMMEMMQTEMMKRMGGAGGPPTR